MKFSVELMTWMVKFLLTNETTKFNELTFELGDQFDKLGKKYSQKVQEQVNICN